MKTLKYFSNYMSSKLSIVGIAFFMAVSANAQEIELFYDNFESGTSKWTLNTNDVGSLGASSANVWIVNNVYQGGTYTFLGFMPVTVVDTKNQPSGVTNSPQSFYLHTVSKDAEESGVANCNYIDGTSAGFVGGQAGTIFTKMATPINTTGISDVTLSFWWLCNGERGSVWYSTDNGNTWNDIGKTYNGTDQWTFESVKNPAFDNKASLLIGFMFDYTYGGGTDPGFAIDEVKLSYTKLTDMEISMSAEINTVCNGFGCNYDGPSILINEVMLAPTYNDGSIYGLGPGFSSGDCHGEWIELYNPDECQSIDISCYFLGNNARDGSNIDYPGGFLIPEGTIIPPQGFCLIRGMYAPAVPAQHLVQNGGKTVEIVINNVSRICLGGGYRLWFPNAGGWFAFYDRNGVPQDAISWGNQSNSCMSCSPCNPGAIGACNYTGILASYTSIPNDRKKYITSYEAGQFEGLSYRRVPDGGDWGASAANPTIGYCNTVCNPEPIITCTGTATVTVSGGQEPYTYQWNDGMAQTTKTAVGLCAGTYCVTVTDAKSEIITGCVTVDEHKLDVTITSNNDICEGEALIFSANASPSSTQDSYVWLGPNSFSSTSASNNITNTTADMSGTYTVTVNDENECWGSASVQLTIFPSPKISFSGNPISGCSPITVQFNDASSGGNINEWNWDFGNGSISNEQNPSNTYTEGKYSVKLFVSSDKGCEKSLTMNDYIEAYPQPIADFTFSPYYGTVIEPNISFTSTSNAQYWLWDFGDGTQDNTSKNNVAHTYPGIDSSYTVTLYLSNDYGCKDSITKEVKIIDDQLTFPNIITPNGDGINDKLEIVNGHKIPNKIAVFNRWGNKVFEQTDYQNDWDGDNLSEGTYYYLFYYYDKIHKSSLTIIR